MDDDEKTRSQLLEDLRDLKTKLRYAESEIAEYRHLESLLKEETQFNNLLINASPAFVVAVDCRGKILLANKAFLGRTGYRMDEIGEVSYLKTFIPPDER